MLERAPMAFGHSITHQDRPPRSLTACSSLPPGGAAAPAGWQSQTRGPGWNGRTVRSLVATMLATFLIAVSAQSVWAKGCLDAQGKPIYLTLDTGHMAVAPLIAEILNRQQVKVTFFAANELTQTGDGSLGQDWAPWWKARGAEGHEFASHTWDHSYWRADLPAAAADGAPRFRIKPSAGPQQGQDLTWSAGQYCAALGRANERLAQITGKPSLPLFRAPGGKTSPQLLAAAKACGYAHVGWSPAGFLGDELASEKYPNEMLLRVRCAISGPATSCWLT